MSNDTFTIRERNGSYPIFRASTAALMLRFVVLLAGCRSQNSSQAPAIEFTRIPPAAQGGRERTNVISGRVVGAGPNQRIVVYARSGPWWVQPWPEKPFIPIQPDHTWSTPTHLGFEYAALLVDPGYEPPPTLDVAPAPGGSVARVETVKGVGAIQLAPTKPLKFSGYDWNIRTIVETGRWGDKSNKNNGQFGIQPFYVPGNLAPFTQPAGTLTHSFRWVNGSASFKTVKGSSVRAGGPVVSEHVFSSGVPTAGEEKFQILFYVVGSDKNPLQHENEVVIEKFQYLP